MPEATLDNLDVCRLLMAECRKAGSQAKWARAHGVSPQTVSDALNARFQPSDAILGALGLRRVVRFVAVKAKEPEPARDVAHLRLTRQPHEVKSA